jgi:predicted TIM-barrel fold metal-dependent hydrolase
MTRADNGPERATNQFFPAADHHQHLFSPHITALLAAESIEIQPITARDVLALLDAAGIRRALLLSVAYMLGSPARTVPDEYERVRAENDWTGVQATIYADRLVSFGSFNPLKPYALNEIERCASHPHLDRGIKLHFGNSDVQLDVPSHVEQLRHVFAAANDKGMAIVVHLRPSISRNRPYGAEQARVFLEQVLPLAPDVPVQVAHLAASGPGYDDPMAQEAMAVLAEAMERGDPRMRQVWFDVATVVDSAHSPASDEQVARFIRQVGVDRVLYGSDAALGDNLRPREGWAAFHQLPLSTSELAEIAANLAPYFN